jgi:hypothetical protein
MIRPWGLLAGSMALMLVARDAGADDTHYRSVPVGAHSIALGGAFTGVADDASTAYFNPAGLALGGTVGIAGGLTVNAWERLDLRRAFDQPDGVIDATTKRARTVPIFIGAAVKLGPKDVLEQKKFTLAVSVVEPIFFSGGVFVRQTSDTLALSDTYEVGVTDRATWYGFSFAGRLNLKQSIGGSIYLSVRKLNHSETGLALAGGAPVPGDPDVFVGTSSAANTQTLRFKAFHFVVRFGWLYRIKPQLQLGLMVQPPGIPLKQTVNTLSQGFVNDNRDPTMPGTTRAYFADEKVDAKLPLPAEIEVGLEYWPAEKVMLALDASFHGPVRSGQRVEISDTVPVGGLFFDGDTGRRAIGNVAIGGDFMINKTVTIETGFFTDLSSARKIPENPDQYYNPRIHRYGATLSLRLNVSGIALAVGSTFIAGKGDATGVVVDVNNLGLGYTRTEARSRLVYLHLTGATRAAEDLGDRGARRIKARSTKKKKKNEAEKAGE